jgi:hypothetical protein
MRARRLTDSQLAQANPAIGFELMKVAHCQLRAVSSARSHFLKGGRFGARIALERISVVDNASIAA